MSIELVLLSNHPILCCPLLPLLQIFQHLHQAFASNISSSILTWRIPWTEENVCGVTELDKIGRLLMHQVSHSFPSREHAAFNFMAAVTIYSDFGEENKVCRCFHHFPSICHESTGLDVMILVFFSVELFHSALSPSSRAL